VDPYILALLGAVGLASVLPARGAIAAGLSTTTTVAIGGLFFLYGARLSTTEALRGLRHWRLHCLVLVSTFALFPLIGLAARVLVPVVLPPELYVGLLFLCCLPSTVQSSIAFTSIARGNVAAAICSASFSNLIGVAVTPLLVTALLPAGHGGGLSAAAIRDIALQLLAPFVAGQLARPLLGGFVTRHKARLGLLDKGSIVLVVYAAFSGGVVAGIWRRVTPATLAWLLVVDLFLLTVVLLSTTLAARLFGFHRDDEITIVFCGSKKSLASGVPMASVLFPATSVGLAVLPLMLFHQAQLMACAWLARRYAATGADATADARHRRPPHHQRDDTEPARRTGGRRHKGDHQQTGGSPIAPERGPGW
jgi:sodium/bile acid cotransporter 7